MPDPHTPLTPQRTPTSRLGEGLVMTVTMLIFRLILVWLNVLHESFGSTLISAVMFGLFWVLISLVWDRVRARRADR